MAIAADNFLYSPASIAAPAGESFRIVFTNNDTSIPHNVSIRDGGGASRFDGKIFVGVATVTYPVPALASGTYQLACIVHPAMTGTLTAG